jgi:hypothetical protein
VLIRLLGGSKGMADLLFRPGAAFELYKRPQKIYDFKMSGMKVMYDRVSGPCSHSSSIMRICQNLMSFLFAST